MTSKRNINNRIDELEDDAPDEETEIVLNEEIVGTTWDDEYDEDEAGEVIDEETTVFRIGGDPP